MKDNIKLVPLKLKGHVKVEMFDKEGNLLHTQEGDNYIAHGVNALLRRVQMSWLTAGLPNNMNKQYGTLANDGIVRFAQYLTLTDYDGAVDSAADAIIRGNVVGWCQTTELSNSDPKSGLLNVAESYVDLDKIHLVFDFATDRANGTFRSAYLSDSNKAYKATDLPMTPILSLARRYDRDLCYADSYFWTRYGNTVYKINPSTGAEEASYDIGETIHAMTVHNSYIYAVYRNYNSPYRMTLYKYEISTGTKTYISVGNGPNDNLSVVADGTYIYVCCGNVITKVDIATFTFLESKSFSEMADVFTLKNGNIYGNNDSSLYHAFLFDFANGTTTPSEYITCGKQVASDGVNDYVMDSYDIFYKRQGTNTKKSNYMLCTTSLSSKSAIGTTTRWLFASPTTKDDTQNMKITYEIEFS